MSAPELAVVRERAEQARGDALEAIVAQQAEHTASIAEFARKLADALTGMGMVPAEVTRHMLLAVATLAAQGGPKP